MNRRGFFGLFGAAAVGAALPAAVVKPRFPVLTIDGWLAHQKQTGEFLHVYIDHEDVTLRCHYAAYDDDGIHGRAECYVRDQDGRVQIDRVHGGPLRETRCGVLRIEPGPVPEHLREA